MAELPGCLCSYCPSDLLGELGNPYAAVGVDAKGIVAIDWIGLGVLVELGEGQNLLDDLALDGWKWEKYVMNDT